MILAQDAIQAGFEIGSACFGLLNIRAIRKAKTLAGVHWLPTFFFMVWGVWNLIFYYIIGYPASWWAGLAITIVNAVWLAHVAYYRRETSA